MVNDRQSLDLTTFARAGNGGEVEWRISGGSVPYLKAVAEMEARADAIGRTPEQLLSHEAADAGAKRRLADAARLAQPCRVEILNRGRDGPEFWVDTEVQPLLHAHA